MAQSILETYRKAVLDSGITGKDWRKTEAFDEFSVFYNTTYSEEQRKSMTYKSILANIRNHYQRPHQSLSLSNAASVYFKKGERPTDNLPLFLS
jgi:hypothetical protein